MRVHYYGHVGQGTGYAVATEQTCKALLRAGVDLTIRPLAPRNQMAFTRDTEELLDHVKREDLGPCDVVIVHTLPYDCAKVLGRIDGHTQDVPVAIAYTTWEGYSAPPDLGLELGANFNEAWVPSEVTRSALGSPGMGTVNVAVVPHAFDDAATFSRASRLATEPYRFYYIGAWTSRKNPAGLVRAYANAFTRDDRVELHIHSAGASTDSILAAVAQTGVAQVDLPVIKFRNERVTDDKIATMHAKYDCFVTASRGEAWNLPCFDAARYGNHVIAPGHLGSNEYLLGSTAQFVNWTVQPACVDVEAQRSLDGNEFTFTAIGAQGMSARTLWCEPDLVDLAKQMRTAVAHHHRDVTIRYNDLARRFGYAAVGKRMLTLLEGALS